MYRHVAGLEQPAMPMQGTALTAAEIATLKQWIDDGAKWDAAAAATASTPAATAPAWPPSRIGRSREERSYWAFKLPVQAPLPVVARKDLTNPIDRFLEGRAPSGD